MIIHIYNGCDKDIHQYNDLSKSCYQLYNNQFQKIGIVYDEIQDDEQIFRHECLGKIEKTYFSISSTRSNYLRNELKKAGKSLFERSNAHFILDEFDNCIGSITLKSNKLKEHKLLTYNSEIFCYKDCKFESYEIGFGNDGQFYVVFKDNKLEAIIKNDYFLQNNLLYEIYSKNYNPELIHLAMYYFMDRIYSTRKYTADIGTLYTPYKEIRDLFDANFIDSVKLVEKVNV